MRAAAQAGKKRKSTDEPAAAAPVSNGRARSIPSARRGTPAGPQMMIHFNHARPSSLQMRGCAYPESDNNGKVDLTGSDDES